MTKSYSSVRVAQERAAASHASDSRARRCHEQLAELHAGPAGSKMSGHAAEDEPVSRSSFIIIG